MSIYSEFHSLVSKTDIISYIQTHPRIRLKDLDVLGTETFAEFEWYSIQDRKLAILQNLTEIKCCPGCNSQILPKQRTCGKSSCRAAAIMNGMVRIHGGYYTNRQKATQTLNEKYGVDNPGQISNHSEKCNETRIKNFGDPTFNNPDKRRATCNERYGVDNPAKIVGESGLYLWQETMLERYGTIHQALVKDDTGNYKWKATRISRYGGMAYNNREQAVSTCLERYGYRNMGFLAQTSSGRFKIKHSDIYGKEYSYQGYEDKTIRYFLTNYDITHDDLITSKVAVPHIQYISVDGKERTYFPDMFIPSLNLIVETKSSRTWEIDNAINILKIKATVDAGYAFRLFIW